MRALRVLVVGAGAVGGFLGARLVQAGADVTFLARGRRLTALRSSGVVLVGTDGAEQHVEARAIGSEELHGPYDVVLLAVKAPALPGAMDDIAPAVGRDTIIVPTLNGVRHLRTLADRFGSAAVLGGVCIVATELDVDGRIRQLNDGASLTVGAIEPTQVDRVEALRHVLEVAAFDSGVSDAIVQDMWEKWLLMVVGGAATVLLGGSAGTITSVDGGPAVVSAVIDEALAVLRAGGHTARLESVGLVSDALTTPGSSFTTSLYRDYAAARATEVEPVLGDFVRTARALQLRTPLLDAATVRLRVHELGLH